MEWKRDIIKNIKSLETDILKNFDDYDASDILIKKSQIDNKTNLVTQCNNRLSRTIRFIT